MANTITLTFAGDDKSLSRSFDAVDKGAREMADTLSDTRDEASRFTKGIGSMNERIDGAESKFMGTADLLDGLTSAFGINVGGTIDMARAYGDMAGGFASTVGPALEGLSGKLGKLSIVTKAQTLATAGLNAVMNANPALLIVAGIAALIAVTVLAYKKVDWFRAGVDAAFSGIKKGVDWIVGAFSGMVDSVGRAFKKGVDLFGKYADVMTTPYRLAFNGIADLWNNTIGALHFSIPGWVPGIGGNGFDVPDIPKFASGGQIPASGGIVGERGPELFVPGIPGTIVPNHQLGGGGMTVVIQADSSDPWVRAIRQTVRVIAGTGPDSVQKAFG